MEMRTCHVSKQTLASRLDIVMVVFELAPAEVVPLSQGSSHEPLVMGAILRGSEYSIKCRGGLVIRVGSACLGWPEKFVCDYYDMPLSMVPKYKNKKLLYT
ncbi:hypothetical protein AVEN_80323-1 [Araneus ventricosus]|uniref:Uncharacterized protein n=1 Tax=Araneus ventricosus TaxID=182803 RepID=A0A4Y2RGB1_ARAVE|nr:hypothetical protein AVEN_273821-1 [Araneus ventricosus]GBN74737.1 hypothetical protein AVEN_53890-1 [Araneus ventricosus]GBN74743.1 hypothetical protein AVEN_62589-1 [Araneus ventricosus]GBN74749.1 hypothetical protein AVEN_80323-1 [Araneus ventricosus]